jgi:FeS assembly SUF system regulator
MIRITKQTDYGIVLLTHLATNPDHQYAAPELATETRMPLPMVSKILKLLARDGILASHRGVKGGYSLARPAEEVSVAEVVAALEGPIALTECVSVESGCSHEALCPVSANWRRINEAVRVALEGISLAEMAQPNLQKSQKLVTLGRGALPGVQLQEI